MAIEEPCAEFYSKWIKDGNFCGVSEREAKLVNQFIPFAREVVEKSGFTERLIYKNINPRLVKPAAILKKGNPLREKAIEHIIETLKSNAAPTKETLEDAMGIEHHPKRIVDPNTPRKEVSRKTILVNKGSSAEKMNEWFLSGLNSGQKLQWKTFANKIDSDNEYLAFCYITTQLDKLIRE